MSKYNPTFRNAKQIRLMTNKRIATCTQEKKTPPILLLITMEWGLFIFSTMFHLFLNVNKYIFYSTILKHLSNDIIFRLISNLNTCTDLQANHLPQIGGGSSPVIDLSSCSPPLPQDAMINLTHTHYPYSLPTSCSNHPLDTNISNTDISLIIKFYHTPDSASLSDHLKYIQGQHFLALLSFNSPIDDTIINSCLRLVATSMPSPYHLSSFFFSTLICQGWTTAYNTFFNHPLSNIRHAAHKPTLTSPIILIPVHTHGSHWVAVARIHSLYHTKILSADDLGSSIH
jgi:hypothetical protein